MVKNLAQQGVINLSGVRPQLAKVPTKTLQDQTKAPVNFIPVYLACVCVFRFIRWFWLSAPILPTITSDNRESTVPDNGQSPKPSKSDGCSYVLQHNTRPFGSGTYSDFHIFQFPHIPISTLFCDPLKMWKSENVPEPNGPGTYSDFHILRGSQKSGRGAFATHWSSFLQLICFY
jgi:hypothetical protein